MGHARLDNEGVARLDFVLLPCGEVGPTAAGDDHQLFEIMGMAPPFRLGVWPYDVKVGVERLMGPVVVRHPAAFSHTQLL
jgi:hypothetical protein